MVGSTELLTLKVASELPPLGWAAAAMVGYMLSVREGVLGLEAWGENIWWIVVTSRMVGLVHRRRYPVAWG